MCTEGLCTPGSHMLCCPGGKVLSQRTTELRCLCGYSECCDFYFNDQLLYVLLNQESYCYMLIILAHVKVLRNGLPIFISHSPDFSSGWNSLETSIAWKLKKEMSMVNPFLIFNFPRITFWILAFQLTLQFCHKHSITIRQSRLPNVSAKIAFYCWL